MPQKVDSGEHVITAVSFVTNWPQGPGPLLELQP
jgi:hypothetical protein